MKKTRLIIAGGVLALVGLLAFVAILFKIAFLNYVEYPSTKAMVTMIWMSMTGTWILYELHEMLEMLFDDDINE